MSNHDFPSYEETERRVDAFVAAHTDVARVETLGASPEGRPVRAVHVTEPDAPEAGKQVALVVCGRHGNELGTRVVGPAVLQWLASEAGAPARRRQHVMVVPVANPDGSARAEFGAPPRHLSELEQQTVIRLADRWLPDAVIDVHSFGPGDGDLEAVVTGNTTAEGEDQSIYHRVAAQLIDGAARAGYPFVLHTEKRGEGYNNFVAGWCYDRCHALAFGMEVNHHALAPDDAAASGAAVVAALLGAGNRRWPWETDDGYPVNLLRGDFFTSLRAAGRTAGDRRTSRAALCPNRTFFSVPRREAPHARTVRVTFAYSGYTGSPLGVPVALCCRVRGRSAPRRVLLNGTGVEPRTFTDVCSTWVSVELVPVAGTDYELTVEL